MPESDGLLLMPQAFRDKYMVLLVGTCALCLLADALCLMPQAFRDKYMVLLVGEPETKDRGLLVKVLYVCVKVLYVCMC